MSLVAAGSVTGFFEEAVKDAVRTRKVEVSAAATTYVVGVLCDFARQEQRREADRPLLFLLDDALKVMAPAERFERLRQVGDGVLYGCGFFRDHFEARGIDEHYLYGIGTCAYGTASSMLRASADSPADLDLFGELAEKFEA